MYLIFNLNGELIEELDILPELKSFTGIIGYTSGSRFWVENGLYHRLDGPALVYVDGRQFYYINGIECTETHHKLYIDMLKIKGIKS